jgi:hypothetical protein
MVFLGEAYLHTGMITGASSHLHDVQFQGGRFEYVSPIRRGCGEGQSFRCVNDVIKRVLTCGCFDQDSDAYMGPAGWKEVDISQVPPGTPLVDDRLRTYNLKFY